MTHSLTLGSRLLTDSFPDDEHGFVFNVLADGLGFGVAKGVQEVITSLLADGDLVRIDRYGNREVSFAVEITGPSLGALAHGEAALRRELGKPNTLTWQAPDVLSVPTVFDVVTSEMSQTFDDLDELRRSRTFVVTLTCAPFARSADLTTVAALEVGTLAASVSIDTCDSAAGWSADVNGTSVAVSTSWSAGAVSVTELLDPAPQTLSMTRTGTVDFSANRYLVVEVGYNSTFGNIPIAAKSGSTELAKLEQRLIEPGWYRCAYDTAGATLSSLTFSGYFPMEYADLMIRQVSATNVPSQTPRQVSRILDVGGTERTPGSLRVSATDGTSPLSLTVVATWPETGSGFSPPLRRWRTGGNAETVDTNTLSGKREPLNPSYVYFDIPIESLPQGTYQMMGLMASGLVGTFAVESVIQSRHAGVTLGETTWGAGGTETVDFPVANDWKLVPLGVYGVPIVAAKAGEFRIMVKTPDATSVSYDEVWLFPVDDDCALSAILTDQPHIWLDSPDQQSRAPKFWEGSLADKGDARWPMGLHTMGNHVFTPSQTAVFIASFGVDWPEATLTYHKRWHSNAAED